MTSIFGQLGLLLWKNWLIQKRSPVWSVFELLIPAALAFLVILPAIISEEKPPEFRDERRWPGGIAPSDPKSVTGTREDYNNLNYGRTACRSGDHTYKIFTNLYYAPDTDLNKKLMNRIALAEKLHLNLTGFADEASMMNKLESFFGRCASNKPCPCVGVLGGVLLNIDKSKNQFSYEIRLPNLYRFRRRFVKPWRTQIFARPEGNYKNSDYFETGFLSLQKAIDFSLIEEFGANPSQYDNAQIQIQAFARRTPYTRESMIAIVTGLIIVYAFLIMLIFTIRNVVHEKEAGLKEYMKVMGLRNWLQWLSHFVWSFMKLALLSIYFTVLFCIHIKGQAIMPKSDWSLVFVFFLLLSAGIIFYAFAISVFFQNATAAMAVGGILYFLLALLAILAANGIFNNQYNHIPWSLGANILILLVNNMAMSQGFALFGKFEAQGAGLKWKYFFTPINVDEKLTIGLVFIMLIVDMFICLLIAWYVEAVNPGVEGVPQKPWFPFQLSYWRGGTTKEDSENQSWRRKSIKAAMSATVENVPENQSPTIQIGKLVKVYKNGKVLAVNGLNLEMYPGQITALLGHNGAGKTTTMKILTGILPATSGSVFIGGFDLKNSLPKIRQQLGLCPQNNILYDMLTVQEHLELFCKLKGRKIDQSEIEHILKVLNIEDKRHKRTSTLSGGMKRKVGVAIALIGGSEVVFLDEPTSGMDPAARHSMWEFLKVEKNSRTIILSTHYMEEADVLGDRIAIIAKGQLQCCGSSLFLKKHYGTGYSLTVVFDNVQRNEQNSTGLLEMIRKHCPDSELQSAIGLEASYNLPTKHHSSFGQLFAELEDAKSEYNVASFGVSITTMEDVFLRVGHIAEGDDDEENMPEIQGSQYQQLSANTQNIELNPMDEGISRNTLANTPEIRPFKESSDSFHDISSDLNTSGLQVQKPYTGPLLWLQQLKGLLIKRFHLMRRYWALAIPQIVVPLIFAIFCIIIYHNATSGSGSVKYGDMIPLKLNLDKFSHLRVPVFDENNDKIVPSYKNLSSKLGLTVEPVQSGSSMDTYIGEQYNMTNNFEVTQHYLIGASFQKPRTLTAFYHVLYEHVEAISLNILDSAILGHSLGDSNVRIEVTNAPLPDHWWKKPVEESQYKASSRYIESIAIFIILLLCFGMAFLISSFVIILVKERASGAKHLQILSGTHQSIFWLGHTIFDMATFLVPTIIIIILFAIFGVKIFIAKSLWILVFFVFLLYGLASLARVYLISFLFKTPGRAYILSMLICIIIGTIVIPLISVLETRSYWPVLEVIFGILFPNFCLAECLTLITSRALGVTKKDHYSTTDEPSSTTPSPNTTSILSWEKGIGRYIFFFFLQMAFYWCMVALAEIRVFAWIWDKIKPFICCCNCCCCHKATSGHGIQSSLKGDDDVHDETDTVSKLTGSECPVIARQLVKEFGSFRAVNGLSFHVAQSDCFGLLGVNGAGKTTTFEMLIGNHRITSGDAKIAELDIARSWRRAGRNLGYCPQFDAILGRLTGYETLDMFARLRGIPEKEVTRVTKAVIDSVGIEKYANRLTKTYSGGNKRRLSLGIALVGLPKVLLLDEPTTGVDPAARRSIWDILSQLRQQGIAIILSSHSMEECDALCTRIAIMARGSLLCIGSSQHLKTKYGTGYSLQLKVDGVEAIEPAKQTIAEKFPGSVLKEIHETVLIYELPQEQNGQILRWSSMFNMLESLVEPLKIIDYSLSQTTLEQVFLKFSRDAEAETEGYNNPVTIEPSSVAVHL